MSEFLKQHVALLSAALLAWFSWSHLTEEGAQALQDKARLTPLAARYLETRGADEGPLQLPDPYRLPGAPAGSAPLEGQAPDAPPAGRPEQPGDEEPAIVIDSRPLGTARQPVPRVEVVAERPSLRPVSLWVDAILAVPGGEAARICGHRVPLGGAVPGVDDEEPPVLAALGDASVEISYRGRSYSLSLDDEPLLVTAEAGPGEALPPAPAEAPGGSP